MTENFPPPNFPVSRAFDLYNNIERIAELKPDPGANFFSVVVTPPVKAMECYILLDANPHKYSIEYKPGMSLLLMLD